MKLRELDHSLLEQVLSQALVNIQDIVPTDMQNNANPFMKYKQMTKNLVCAEVISAFINTLTSSTPAQTYVLSLFWILKINK